MKRTTTTANVQSSPRQRWSDLGIKDRLSLISACVSFALGFVLLFLGLFLGEVGNIKEGVLVGFGTTLIYAGGIFGVTMYFKYNNNEMYESIMQGIQDVIIKKIEEKNNKDAED